jgi:MFS family permease
MTIARTTPPEAARGSGAALAVLLMAPFLAQADATIANVATPAIRLDLAASAAAVELVIGGYLISFAVLLIIGARLGQARGCKRTFQLGIIVFGVASLGGGLAPNASVLILMRIAQGAGAALMFPQALTGIQQGFTGALRSRAIGLYALALSAGAVTGQVLGGVLVSADVAGSGWRAILLVNVPVCAAVGLAAHRCLPAAAPGRVTRLDVRGAAVLAVAVLLIVIPLTLGADLGWPRWLWTCLAASVPAFWLFWAGQRRAAAAGRAPLVNVGALAAAPIVLALVTLLVGTGTYYALLFTLAQYFQSGLGRSA